MGMTFLDLFSGIGGFRHGFELCGIRCVGHCEIDKFAERSYRALYDVGYGRPQNVSFVDLSKGKPKLTDVARCIKAKYDSGVTNRRADNSGVFYGRSRDKAGKLFAGHGRIRRLTPRECWRLQGFSDAMFEKAQAVNSDSQLYRQAGNSVTVTVVYTIGKRILEVQKEFEREKESCAT